MLLCPYFCFYRHLSLSKHVDMFFDFGFHLRTSEVKAWGSWYVHFASCFLAVIYNVFIHNNAFWSNSNAFSLIICKEHTKRENSGSWKSGPGKATSGHLFCTTPNELKLHGEFLWIIWGILEPINTRGATRWAQPTWACQGPQARTGGLCPPRPTFGALLLVYKLFWPIKSQERTSGMKRHCLEVELGQEHFCSLTKRFRWGYFPPGG